MLSVTLEAQFTSDGDFDFAATLDGLAASLFDADFGDVEFDATGILDLIAGLAPPEIGNILASAGAALNIVGDLGDMDSIAGLLDPLRRATGAVQLGGQIDIDSLGSGIDETLGINAIGLRIDNVTAAVQEGPIGDLFAVLAELVPGVSLGGAIGKLQGPVGGVAGLVTLAGGLMATEALTVKLLNQSKTVDSMLDVALARDAGIRLERLATNTSLAAGLATIDPADLSAVERVIAPIDEFMRTVHEVRDVWTQGLAFGEGALLGLDVAGCAAGLVVARAALDEAALAPVGELAVTIRGLVDPVLDLPLPDPAGSLDEIVGEGLELLVELRDNVAAFDAAGVVGIVTGSLEAIVAPITEVVATLETVAASVSSAIRTVRDLVQDIDLSPVEIAIDTVVEPVRDVLGGIETAIAVAQEPIVTVAETVSTVLVEIRGSIEGAAALITTALGRLSAALDAVDIAAVQEAIESGLGAVVETLTRAQLAPYFDTAIDVIDTTADVVDAVPFGVLPTDVQQEVVDAVKPVKEIRFDVIADRLQAELSGIIAALNTDVLDEVDAAYQAVLGFLASVDPKAAILEFEDGPFAEFRATVAAIDPAAVLEPVEAALAEVQGLLSGVDISQDVLAPIQAVFDDLIVRYDDLDPRNLLEPARAEVDGVRQEVIDSLRLDEWAPAIQSVRDFVVTALDRIEPAAIATGFDRSTIDGLLSELPSATGPIGAIVSSLSQAAGMAADADAWAAVATWFGEVDGRLSIEGRLQASAELLGNTRDAVRQLDPAPLVAAAQAQYRALQAAADNLAADTLLKDAVEPLLAGPSPAELLGPIIENRGRYLARLDLDAAAMLQVSGNGHSEINAITDGLTDALRPITSIGAWLRSLLARFGVTDPERPFVSILETLLDIAGPDRVLPPLRDLIAAIRDKVTEIIDAALAPALEMTTAIESAVGLIDIGPVIDEVTSLHAEIGGQIAALTPEALLGDVIARFDATVDRLETFDPLAPVRGVIDDMTLTVETTFDTLRPTVIFQDVCDIYATILELAGGLDVRGLLEPILTALEGIALQLDVGLEETAEALGRLQAALPGEVSSSSLSGSVSVSGGISL